MIVFAVSSISSRGRAGAPGSVPGTISSSSCWLCTPKGKIANSSTHQMMKYVAVPRLQVIRETPSDTHRFDANHGLLAPCIAGSPARCDSHMLFNIVRGTSIEGPGNRVTQAFLNARRYTFHIEKRFGCQSPPAIEYQRDSDKARK